MGFLDVLNIGRGHLSIKFDQSSDIEVEKARRVIGDMLKRGYLLLVEIDGQHRRVKEFDPKTNEYLVEFPADTVPEPIVVETTEPSTPSTPRRRGRPPVLQRMKLTESRATAIGPTAGG